MFYLPIIGVPSSNFSQAGQIQTSFSTVEIVSVIKVHWPEVDRDFLLFLLLLLAFRFEFEFPFLFVTKIELLFRPDSVDDFDEVVEVDDDDEVEYDEDDDEEEEEEEEVEEEDDEEAAVIVRRVDESVVCFLLFEVISLISWIEFWLISCSAKLVVKVADVLFVLSSRLAIDCFDRLAIEFGFERISIAEVRAEQVASIVISLKQKRNWKDQTFKKWTN